MISGLARSSAHCCCPESPGNVMSHTLGWEKIKLKNSQYGFYWMCIAFLPLESKKNEIYVLSLWQFVEIKRNRLLIHLVAKWGFLGGSVVKNLPVMQKTWILSLGWEYSLRRKWQLSPVFLPGKFHRQRSLVGYSIWGHKRVRQGLVTKQI